MDTIDPDTLLDVLREHLTITVDTETPPYSGAVFLKVTVNFKDEEVCSAMTPLPSIAQLKRSEYNDY